MAYFSSNAKDFLGELAIYLDQIPVQDSSALGEIPSQLDVLLVEGDIPTATQAVRLLGTAVGKQRQWQTMYRTTGILEFILQQLRPRVQPPELAKQYLRVIGNCVADNDEIRELTLPKLDDLITCLEQPLLTTTALAVLLNLCNEYDAAQSRAAGLRLDNTIVKLLASGKIPEEAGDYATDLIGWATEKLTSAQIEEPTSMETFETLLGVTLQYDEDNYHDQIAILAHYLQYPSFQERIVEPRIIGSLVELLFDYEARLEPNELQNVSQCLGERKEHEKESSEEAEVLLMIQLINSLSAVSASDAFIGAFDLENPLIEKLIVQLQQSSSLPSSVCACVMLGNLATSDDACLVMVQKKKLHVPLIRLIPDTNRPALAYAAAGFVRHLAFPEENRTVLADAGLIEACCCVLVHNDPSVRGEAAAILGKLATNNLHNVRRMVAETVPNDIVPEPIPNYEVPMPATILYHITSQALMPSAPVPSTTMKNAMIEIGRTIVAILRVIRQSESTEEDISSLTDQFFETKCVARPIARLIRQRFFTDARSDGLLGLGLMAQSPEGARLVVEEFKVDEGLFDALKDFLLEGKTNQKQDGQTLSRDHQNAIVLMHGLAKHGDGAMSTTFREQVNSLQTELGNLLSSI